MMAAGRTSKKTASGNKTVPTGASVDAFLRSVDNERRVEDCRQVMALMQAATGCEPRMWGNSIIGYGEYRYRYDSGREGDALRIGVSPRKQNLVLYIMPGFDAMASLQAKLGKHKVGKSCLYVNRLEDIHLPTLKKMIARSVSIMRKRYPE